MKAWGFGITPFEARGKRTHYRVSVCAPGFSGSPSHLYVICVTAFWFPTNENRSNPQVARFPLPCEERVSCRLSGPVPEKPEWRKSPRRKQ